MWSKLTTCVFILLWAAPHNAWLRAPSARCSGSALRLHAGDRDALRQHAEATATATPPVTTTTPLPTPLRRQLKGLAAAAMFALAGPIGDNGNGAAVAASAPVVTVAQLEAKIGELESAGSRDTVLQALADVFEAAESKTLLVRTRYKYRIVNAINAQHVKLGNEWDSPLGYASGELKRRADPYRTVDLAGYLKVAPVVGGVGYLGALFVQQALPELFIFAYPLAVAVFAIPIVFIIVAT